MANVLITGLTAANSIDGAADVLPISQSATTKKITRDTLLGITGSPVGTSDSQTLTNKIIDTAGTNTIKVNGNTLSASAGTATITLPNSTTTLVGTDTTNTLTNKTLTTPTIASFTNATHNHTNSAGGGQITSAAFSSAVTVSKGGTGLTSATAYGVLIGGTTSTGAFQSVAVGTSGQVLTSNGAGAAPTMQNIASGYMTLLKANSGTDTNAAAATVDTYAISGLTAKDTIYIEYNANSVTDTTAAGSIYHSTDATALINTSALTASTGEFATFKIRQAQNDATVYQASMYGRGAVALGSGGTTTADVTSYQDLSTSFQGSWTIGLRHGGVTAGGTYRWSWAVYKIAGQ